MIRRQVVEVYSMQQHDFELMECWAKDHIRREYAKRTKGSSRIGVSLIVIGKSFHSRLYASKAVISVYNGRDCRDGDQGG